MIHNSKFKILVVIGPTASGKSELAVKLAKKYNGEIISCDSRQIYRGMNLGTGKVTGKWQSVPFASHPERSEGPCHSERAKKSNYQQKNSYTCKIHGREFYKYKGIFHHLIDFQNPARQYSVARFQKEARKAIKDIICRNKIPILCGGSMHYIDAVVYNQNLPDIKPNKKLRTRLEKLTTLKLYEAIRKKDPARAKTIDKHNRRRLIRALEIIMLSKNPVPVFPKSYNLTSKTYLPLWLGITLPKEILYNKIDKRLLQRLKQGMIKEVEQLHSPKISLPLFSKEEVGGSSNPKSKILNLQSINGLSWKKLESFGLEYKYIALYLQNKLPAISPPQKNSSSPLVGEVRACPVLDTGRGVIDKRLQALITQLSFAIKHYSKRQMTWWKRNKEIVWIKPDIKKAEKLVNKFLKT